MITTTTARMQPLPVEIPGGTIGTPAPTLAPAPAVPAPDAAAARMQPLPVPHPELAGPGDVVDGAALDRMLDRLGVRTMQPLPVVHPV